MSTNFEHDALILSYSHLKGLKREAEALHCLKKIASLVKPIMRARNWRVGTLTEFYPKQKNLLGLNVNEGQKICLRLRYASDKNQFLPLEEVVDTLLHELCHNEIGPHNQQFHALWDQLRKEHEGLTSKGYTGEGFLSEGRSLGGRRVPRHEAGRVARLAAEKRQNAVKGSDRRLGGRQVPYGTDIRKVIVDAIERRNKVLIGCGDDKMNPIEIKALADEATYNGFKTKAEEDEANDAAIAQALWELVQENQKQELGDLYIPPCLQNPAGHSSGIVEGHASNGHRKSPSKQPASKKNSVPGMSSAGRGASRPPLGNISPTVLEDSKRSSKPPRKPSHSRNESRLAPTVTGWTCTICTLHNPIEYLCCDACMTERLESITKQVAQNTQRKAAATKPPVPQIQMWTCRQCSTKMQNQWWTCSTCGKMKENS